MAGLPCCGHSWTSHTRAGGNKCTALNCVAEIASTHTWGGRCTTTCTRCSPQRLHHNQSQHRGCEHQTSTHAHPHTLGYLKTKGQAVETTPHHIMHTQTQVHTHTCPRAHKRKRVCAHAPHSIKAWVGKQGPPAIRVHLDCQHRQLLASPILWGCALKAPAAHMYRYSIQHRRRGAVHVTTCAEAHAEPETGL